MKIEEPRVMRELHEIRARHYEETKNMTREEYLKSVNDKAMAIMKKYNLKFKIVEKH